MWKLGWQLRYLHVDVLHLPELGVVAVPLAVRVSVGEEVLAVHVGHGARPAEAGGRARGGGEQQQGEGPGHVCWSARVQTHNNRAFVSGLFMASYLRIVFRRLLFFSSLCIVCCMPWLKKVSRVPDFPKSVKVPK